MLERILLFFCSALLSAPVFSQVISGNVKSTEGKDLAQVVIHVKGKQYLAQTDKNGHFEFNHPGGETITLTFKSLGYKTTDYLLSLSDPSFVQIYMQADPLELEGIIVTGTFAERPKHRSPVSVSTLSGKVISERKARGIADLLEAVPGTFTDASAGEVFTRVYGRGISASAEDDHGWYYVSLQEDGLPVTATQHKFYSPDLFLRTDPGISRLEALRGGSASVTAHNAPGGVFNFITKTGTPSFGGQVSITGALQGDNNAYTKLETHFGGPIGKKDLFYSLSGFYRWDEGPRNTDFTWTKGGQIRFNLLKKINKASIKLYGKWLDDHVNRYIGLPATNWSDPQEAFDMDFNTSALMLPAFSTQIADGLKVGTNPSATRSFNPENGINTKDLYGGLEVNLPLNDWTLNNNLKVSRKSASWQTVIGNQPLPLESFLPYFLTGHEAPWGVVAFRDAISGELLARVDNTGALNAFAGLPPTFDYLEGKLPNDALMGSAPWQKDDSVTEYMNQLSLQKKWSNHELTLGAFAARSEVSSFTTASFAFATYEALPRMLEVSLENPGTPIVQLSDNAGVANYGALFFEKGEADVNQLALYINDFWEINQKITLDAGLRYERINHNGSKDRPVPFIQPGGLDGDPLTAFDNAVLTPGDTKDEFDYTYSHLSWSAGINYDISGNTALFTRFSSGNKAPELSYYFSNFANIPINEKGSTQKILQAESGIKHSSASFSLFATAFWSALNNVPFSEFVFDENGQIFYSPVQFNKTRTVGLEIEGEWNPAKNLSLRFSGTLQKARAEEYTIYDTGGTTEEGDDKLIDHSGNKLPHNPVLSFEAGPKYTRGRFDFFGTWRFMGKREGNISNSFELPAFSVFHAGINMETSKNITIGLTVKNILNSKGLMNFFGPNEFGSNANQATNDYIINNPDASFVVFPLMPRSFYLTIDYHF